MNGISLMMVAGERSGDVYGADLARALRQRLPEATIFGCGGELMRRAGVETVVDAEEFAMVGITEVVSGLPRAWRAFRRLVREAGERRPALVVLIDSPSLNIRLAKAFKRRGMTVVYFISPQVWAWKRWRLGQLKKRIDKMICIFGFEEQIYRQAGVPVEYVGHPLAGKVQAEYSCEEFSRQAGLDATLPTVALLPGSRRIEVSLNLPAMLDAASRLATTRRLQFVLAVAPTLDPAWVQGLIARWGGGASIHLARGAAYSALAYARAAVVASGTATVEAALLGCPMVVVYRVSRVTAWLARLMLDVPFYSMVNLLAGRRVVPELIQENFTGSHVASEIAVLLDDAEARTKMVADLDRVRSQLLLSDPSGSDGAIERAAGAVIRMLAPAGAPLKVS